MLGELPAAAAAYQEAQKLAAASGDGHLEAWATNALGRVSLDRGEVAAARRAFEAAQARWRELGKPLDEAEVRSNLCQLEQTTGSLQEALSCYQEVAARFRELGDGSQEERLANNLGGLYDRLGEPDSALESYQRALELRRGRGDPIAEAQSLNNLATVHRALGEWQEALRLYGEARKLLPKGSSPGLEAALANNVGFAYASAGEPQRARAAFEEALAVRRLSGDRRGELVALNNLGFCWRGLGEPARALEQHRAALALARELEDGRQEALTRLRLAEAELDLGQAPAALEELEAALAYLGQSGNRRAEASAWHLQGRALTSVGRFEDALTSLGRALELRLAVRDRAGEAETLTALAAVEARLGQSAAARAHAEQAVARVEQMRLGFVSPELRTAFAATQQGAYETLVRLLMEGHATAPGQGLDRVAFEQADHSRARTLLDALHQEPGAPAVKTLPPELAERRQGLHRRLAAKISQSLKVSAPAADALDREIEGLLAELDGVDAAIRRLDPRFASFSNPPALRLAEIAALLEADTALLEVALGEERSYLWLVEPGHFTSAVLPPRRELEGLAREVYQQFSTLEAGAASPRPDPALKLSELLLGPLWDRLERARRLVVVPDGALQLVPFAALPVPGRQAQGRLIDQLELASLPSAGVLALSRQRLAGRPRAPRLAAVIADPLLAPRFAALPASRREAEEIAALAAPGSVWTALGTAANREAVLAAPLAQFRALHFATHAVADLSEPERSGLVLAEVAPDGRPLDGFLSLSDIYQLDLDADLVVLSGCQTAVGREVRGEGLAGLARGFLYAGAPRVLASLWRVQDRATAELMRRFYQGLWRQGLPAAAALRAAQRELARDPRYRSPASWAAFVLEGDWRAPQN
ncbi:MAG: CHAT domain-containing tetratricopeptide repeat protein [Thermoanaerobaculia bacterium]